MINYSDYLSPTIYRLNFETGERTHYTGVGIGVDKMHDGPKDRVSFIAPRWWQFDAAGNLYVLDGVDNANVVRKVSAVDRSVTTILGSSDAKSVGHPTVNYRIQELGTYDEVNWWHNFLYVTEPFLFLGSASGTHGSSTSSFKVGYANRLVELFNNMSVASAWAEGDELYLLALGENSNVRSATIIYRLSLKQLQQALTAQVNNGRISACIMVYRSF